MVGRIGRPHGLRGQVFVEPRTDEPERRFAPGQVIRGTLRGRTLSLTVEDLRWQQGRMLVAFAGTSGREAAEELRGTELTCAFLPGETPEDPEEYYDHQLVGLRVRTVAGEEVGELLRVEHGAAQDLLVIATPGGEVLFPFVTALVPEVDVPAGTVTVDDVPGLLSPESSGSP